MGEKLNKIRLHFYFLFLFTDKSVNSFWFRNQLNLYNKGRFAVYLFFYFSSEIIFTLATILEFMLIKDFGTKLCKFAKSSEILSYNTKKEFNLSLHFL